MRRRLLLPLAALLAGVPFASRSAAVQTGLSRLVLERLGEPAIVSAAFSQERTAAVLSRPLVSRGHLTVARHLGVIWRIEAPQPMTIAYRDDSITEVDAAGRRRELAASDRRGQAGVVRTLRALLEGDLDRLQRQFEVQATGAIDDWHLALVPRDVSVASYVATIRLAGGRYLTAVEIEETSGDRTRIRIFDVVTPAALRAEERELLGVA